MWDINKKGRNMEEKKTINKRTEKRGIDVYTQVSNLTARGHVIVPQFLWHFRVLGGYI